MSNGEQSSTIEAMKQWLEAFEIAANGGGVNFYEYAKDIRQAIAEAEKQEPVACVNGCSKFFKYTHPQPKREPLTDEQLEKGRDQTFSINNPFCPCDSKTFRKVARWVEAAHGIKENT